MKPVDRRNCKIFVVAILSVSVHKPCGHNIEQALAQVPLEHNQKYPQLSKQKPPNTPDPMAPPNIIQFVVG